VKLGDTRYCLTGQTPRAAIFVGDSDLVNYYRLNGSQGLSDLHPGPQVSTALQVPLWLKPGEDLGAALLPTVSLTTSS
jgi:hypothetical protein